MLLITDAKSKLKEDGNDEDEDLNLIESQILSSGVIIHAVIIGEKNVVCSKIQEENLKFFQSLTKLTGGELVEVEELGDVYPFLLCGLGMGTKPQNRKVTFEISNELRIPCVFWSKVKKTTLPPLKKRVAAKIGQRAVEDMKSTEHGLAIDRSYRNPLDPDEILSVEDRVKGYKYGPQYIPMSFVDEAALKLPPGGEPVVRLLGFLPMDKVARHHYLEGTVVLQAVGDQPSAQAALTALAGAMRNLQRVALVRFVKSGSSDPVLATLVPPDDIPTASVTSLYLHRLPVAEDCRDHSFPKLSDPRLGVPPTVAQLSAMNAFVSSATVELASALTSTSVPSSSSTPALKVPRRRLTTINQPYLSVFGEIQRRLLGLEQSDMRVVTSYDNPFVSVVDAADSRAAHLLATIRESFPLKDTGDSGGGAAADVTVGGGRRKKRSYWSDIDIEVSLEDRSMAGEAEHKEGSGDEVRRSYPP